MTKKAMDSIEEMRQENLHIQDILAGKKETLFGVNRTEALANRVVRTLAGVDDSGHSLNAVKIISEQALNEVKI